MLVRRFRAARLAAASWLLGCAGVFVLVACAGGAKKEERAKAQTAPVAAAAVRSKAKPLLAHRADQVPLEQFVQQHVEEADASGQRVLVYVGATWCEPCQRFHKALEAGELDDALAGTKFIEFDADHDRAELKAAGYSSKYIPLFSVPASNGHSSGRAIEGSIKGDKAVRENLVPRLLALMDGKTID
jgi:thiol:disulfide interchange protein